MPFLSHGGAAAAGIPTGAGGAASSAIAGSGAGGKSNGAGGAASRAPYVPVPDESSGVNKACPICQERFDTEWLDEAQEWVWTDAVLLGGGGGGGRARAFHASCHREATGSLAAAAAAAGGGGSVSGRGATPEGSVLGKRKAEVRFFFLFVSYLLFGEGQG